MITIQLHKVKFHAHHGIHEEENILGNEFEINADIQFHEETEKINSIHQTINYTSIYEIIRDRMTIPSPLLETVIIDIGNAIKEKYNQTRAISIQLKKLHPPITGFQGEVGVSWQKQF